MKTTKELEGILENTKLKDAGEYLIDHDSDLFKESNSFTTYMREHIKLHGKTQQRIFIESNISEKMGYKLISGEKHTRERDTILKLCYAADFSLKETQTALKLYGLSELYAKIPRDALIMIAFNERKGSLIDVNEYLENNGVSPLKDVSIL
ncbi:MAG: hypothetical protein K6A38_07325 [Lachnospiraceae bacterium]|nr:hypothetical protein [Lachnospiraceae bacterium]